MYLPCTVTFGSQECDSNFATWSVIYLTNVKGIFFGRKILN